MSGFSGRGLVFKREAPVADFQRTLYGVWVGSSYLGTVYSSGRGWFVVGSVAYVGIGVSAGSGATVDVDSGRFASRYDAARALARAVGIVSV